MRGDKSIPSWTSNLQGTTRKLAKRSYKWRDWLVTNRGKQTPISPCRVSQPRRCSWHRYFWQITWWIWTKFKHNMGMDAKGGYWQFENHSILMRSIQNIHCMLSKKEIQSPWFKRRSDHEIPVNSTKISDIILKPNCKEKSDFKWKCRGQV